MKSKSAMQSVKGFLGLVVSPFQKLLARLKVFHQILLIILVMVFFLALEGYLGLKINGQMLDLAHQVYQTSFSDFQDISAANQDINQIRKQYSESLMNHQMLLIYSGNIETVMKSYPNEAANFKNALETIDRTQ